MKLGDPAELKKCQGCGAMVMMGPSIALKPIVVDTHEVDIDLLMMIRQHQPGRKFYALDEYGNLIGPVSGSDGFPLAQWRPVHACPWTELQQAPAAQERPPCETGERPGDPAPVWCLRTAAERASGAIACDACCPAPFDRSGAVSGAPVASAEDLLVGMLGAIVIEREMKGRIVYRDTSGSY